MGTLLHMAGKGSKSQVGHGTVLATVMDRNGVLNPVVGVLISVKKNPNSETVRITFKLRSNYVQLRSNYVQLAQKLRKNYVKISMFFGFFYGPFNIH